MAVRDVMKPGAPWQNWTNSPSFSICLLSWEVKVYDWAVGGKDEGQFPEASWRERRLVRVSPSSLAQSGRERTSCVTVPIAP